MEALDEGTALLLGAVALPPEPNCAGAANTGPQRPFGDQVSLQQTVEGGLDHDFLGNQGTKGLVSRW